MKSLVFIIAAILLIGWAFGKFMWNAGEVIHVLLVMAILVLVYGMVKRRKI